ncbi:hypothetical protein V3C99_018207 [Haemonchus contortus]|uniref:Reverse transcriptase domain-containing protein n=1 Tax=Haemonchus contortus TaxID=6289 RepID=A0A7I4Z347_HAECO
MNRYVLRSSISSAALENTMRHSEWEDLGGVRVDCRYPHHLRFADHIVLITPNIKQGERMLEKRKHAAWGAFKNIEEVKKTKDIRFRAHLSDSAFSTALTYASETWALQKQDEHAVSVTQRALEKTCSEFFYTRKRNLEFRASSSNEDQGC